jgi:hypothetical protein
MAEAATPTTTGGTPVASAPKPASSPETSSSTPPAGSGTTTPEPKPKPQPDPAKVKSILAHKAARSGTAPIAESPTTASSSAEKGATSGAADAKADSSKSSSTPASAPEGDPDLALRLARVARAEDSARIVKKEAEALKGELVEYRGWKEARAKDPVAAATAGLTDEQKEAVFWALNDHVLKTDPGRAKDPIEEAKRAALEAVDKRDQERTESETKAQTEARTAAAAEYVGGIGTLFNATPTKWPAVAAWGVPAGDIHTFAQEHYSKTGTVPDAATVLDHFEKAHQARIEAAGYTRQKVEAQPGGEGTANGTNTITHEWSAGAGAASARPDHEMSRRESSEEIKRRRFKR